MAAALLFTRVLESRFGCARPRRLDRLRIHSMPDFLTAEELDTVAKAKAKPEPAMESDVLVIGAGPTGLACAIEAQKNRPDGHHSGQGLPGELAVPLSGKHVIFHDSRVARDRRHPVLPRAAEADPRGGAGVLPQSGRTITISICGKYEW